MSTIKTISVIGAGVMGSGIAQLAIQSGYPTIMIDQNQQLVDKGIATINKNIDRMLQKGKIAEADKENALALLSTGTKPSAAAQSDLVIEAISENLELKKIVFAELDSLCPAHTILATNTSSLSVTAVGSATKRPDRVAGMHFFNPVPVMKLVEVVRSRLSSDETVDTLVKLAEAMGKSPIVAVDQAGFIVARILDVMLNEAVQCMRDGNRPEDIDAAMKLGCNHPMGPFELIDLMGVDVLYHVMETLRSEFGDKYTPAPTLARMVEAGQLGRKTGKGFYKYE
jgi:3-hydroxybutyryl-CoA dehydrogenase